jgi:hypothetical protein
VIQRGKQWVIQNKCERKRKRKCPTNDIWKRKRQLKIRILSSIEKTESVALFDCFFFVGFIDTTCLKESIWMNRRYVQAIDSVVC